MSRGAETEAEFPCRILSLEVLAGIVPKNQRTPFLSPFPSPTHAFSEPLMSSYLGSCLQVHAPCCTPAGAAIHMATSSSCAWSAQSYRITWRALSSGEKTDQELPPHSRARIHSTAGWGLLCVTLPNATLYGW